MDPIVFYLQPFIRGRLHVISRASLRRPVVQYLATEIEVIFHGHWAV